ncbi:MAG: ester cyclase [Panacagrimonas sp.]
MQTNREQHELLMQRFAEAMNARQWDALDDILTPDVVRHCQATPQLDIRSREQFKDFMRQDSLTFPDSQQTFTRIVAENDWVAAWALYEGTQRGAMGPFPASGRKLSFEFAMMMRIVNGRIAEWWVTWDNLTILTQLGHWPPAAASG